MLDSLLQVRYNNKRKILVDFSGFGHLFATQLSCDSRVAFLLSASWKIWQNGGWKLPETLRGVGAVALGYPAQKATQPAVRKQNYIVRI